MIVDKCIHIEILSQQISKRKHKKPFKIKINILSQLIYKHKSIIFSDLVRKQINF